MKQDFFVSDRYFTLFDAVVTHGQLLLRSQMTEVNGTNIDVLFFDTTYIQIFSSLKGISIKQIADIPDCINYLSVRNYLKYKDNRLFEIISNDGEKYYIAASFVKVFENKLAFSQSSINNERGEEIATSII